ncbi:uncharacterized protein LOC122818842 isoform X2 [Drosophila biarmipes]|nr:uncharacterized protein LOC122818842 isoform X2 [Drosophila biarmipes]
MEVLVKDEPRSEDEELRLEEEELEIRFPGDKLHRKMDIEVLVKYEPHSDDEDLRLEKDQLDIKMEPPVVEEHESEEDSFMQEEISVKVESPLLEKVKEEPDFRSSHHVRLATCCMPNCGQKETGEIRLFGFPSDKNLLIQWLVNTQVKPRLVNPAELYVCQLHFEHEDIQGSSLPGRCPLCSLDTMTI